MIAAVRTDKGKRRDVNEDAVYAEPSRGIFLLADGMGGHRAGDVASALAVSVAARILGSVFPLPQNRDKAELLRYAVVHAHERILAESAQRPELQGMGTTLTCFLIEKQTAYLCHVGDSRAYLFRDGLHQLTRDHTLGAYLVSQGCMKREEVLPYQWHALTQAIGRGQSPFPDIDSIALEAGDLLLLCSDGLTDMLGTADIERILGIGTTGIEAAADLLISEANAQGGRDNVSVILIRPDQRDST